MDAVTIRRLHSRRHCIDHFIHSMQPETLSWAVAPYGVSSPPAPAVSSAASLASDVVQAFSASESMLIVNPDGPCHLFIPGGLRKDGCYQHKYKGFVFDLLPSSTSEQISAVVLGCCIGIFPVSYIFFFPSANNLCFNHYMNLKLIAVSYQVSFLHNNSALHSCHAARRDSDYH